MRRVHAECFVRCAMTACSSDADAARTRRVLADPTHRSLNIKHIPRMCAAIRCSSSPTFLIRSLLCHFNLPGLSAARMQRERASSGTRFLGIEAASCLGAASRLPLTHAHGRTVEDKENSSASVTQHSSTRISGHSTQLAGGGVGVSAMAAGSRSVMSRVSNPDAPRASTISQGKDASEQVRQLYEQV